jgi:hypothetical protein
MASMRYTLRTIERKFRYSVIMMRSSDRLAIATFVIAMSHRTAPRPLAMRRASA